jgi:hypothetical protein
MWSVKCTADLTWCYSFVSDRPIVNSSLNVALFSYWMYHVAFCFYDRTSHFISTSVCYTGHAHGLDKTQHTRTMSFLNRARNSRCNVITDLDTSKRSTQKAFSCRNAILETGPVARSKHEKRTAGTI